MRTALIAIMLTAASPVALAQKDTIAAPAAPKASYDPTMSAKEAVLANWELAAAGIRAGKVVGRDVVAMAEGDGSFAALARQAQFAQKTMVQRYNAALWAYTDGSGIADEADSTALTDAVAAATLSCADAQCANERAAIHDAFARAVAELERAAAVANAALEARTETADTVLMAEQLTLMADYLEGGTWADDFNLTAFGRDGEEVSARIVGTMSLWRNIEPYVGLANPEVDNAINAAAEQLLRALRRTTRGSTTLAPDGPELTELRQKAKTLAGELRRAVSIFTA